MPVWTERNIPPLVNRTAVVTGTGGLGFQSALALARAGAKVVIAGRSQSKGDAAVREIRERLPAADVSFGFVDLGSLESIHQFGDWMRCSHERLDILINNAAVMTPPTRQETSDGFELQFGTNYLGHFALTAQLFPLLRASDAPRVISLSSVAARSGALHFDDLQFKLRYDPMAAYSQSKLACLMFALELARRSDESGWGIRSLAVHPGISRTELLINGAGKWSGPGLARRFLWFLFQPVEQGALPTLFAASSPQAESGAYYGPDKLRETRGYPAPARIPQQALDHQNATRLWSVSQALTGEVFP